jgi:hypothetical protein
MRIIAKKEEEEEEWRAASSRNHNGIQTDRCCIISLYTTYITHCRY